MAASGLGRVWLRVGAVSGALAVTAGAYGAHGFRRSDRDEYLKELYATGNQYHFLHSLALLPYHTAGALCWYVSDTEIPLTSSCY
ncbi:transmembrane protein 256 [Mixophyes fleayi]|uniref:transmembrane protein 256 n=1 Tax=Mixophyes fleayi TaxID=3061075 RepID=UPI003F4D8FB2